MHIVHACCASSVAARSPLQLSFSPQRKSEESGGGTTRLRERALSRRLQRCLFACLVACFLVEIDDDEMRRQDMMRHRDRPAAQSYRVCWSQHRCCLCQWTYALATSTLASSRAVATYTNGLCTRANRVPRGVL
jgi:hypothetical protein